MEVEVHVFFKLGASRRRVASFTPLLLKNSSTHWIGGRLDPRAGVDVMANGKFLPCWDRTAAIQPVAWSAWWLGRPSSTTLLCDYRTGFHYARRNRNLQAVLTKYWFTWCCMNVFLAVMKRRCGSGKIVNLTTHIRLELKLLLHSPIRLLITVLN
jgi:hypothetical protein